MSQLSERLHAARRQSFVGRRDLLALFTVALSTAEAPFFLAYIHGPGGLGKTALLHQFASLCRQAAIPVGYIDARNIEPTPERFCSAFAAAFELDHTFAAWPACLTSLADGQRRVLLLDTCEMLVTLDDWLREGFLPHLPEEMLCVFAGRDEPGPAWRADAGWQELMHVYALRNLTPQESQEFLTVRGVHQEQQPAVISFTYGHPLALSLVADVFDQQPDYYFRPEQAVDIISLLVAQLMEQAPGPAHRAALEACSLVRGITEGLLADVLGLNDAHELFQWLRTLSFIDAGPRGLFPHDLARSVLHADLRWRNPDWYAELHRRARNYYTIRYQQTHGLDQQRALFDLIYLHRENPMVQPFFEWQATASLLPDLMTTEDKPRLLAMVEMYEGPQSTEVAAHWLDRQPGNVQVYRDTQGVPVGFLLLLRLAGLDREDARRDPAIHAALRYLDRSAPLRPGETATYFRFWMADQSHQSVSPVQSLIFTNMVHHYLVTPNLAFSFLPCADPNFWAMAFQYADLTRLSEADFEIDGHRWGVYGHDWRVTPPIDWLALLGERELGVAATDMISAPPPILFVLSEEDFAAAVKQAIQHLNRPDRLYDNPLLQSRLIVDRVGPQADGDARAAALQDAIHAALTVLQSSERDRKLHRALHHTYVQPAPTQERAAELLDLPFSTYRRHLRDGISQIVDLLWQHEITG